MDALLSLSNDLAAAVERAAPAVVAVHARRRLPSTGIHWRPGIVVTAEHTVRTTEDITVTMADGRSLPAELAGRDPGTDLAVLRVADAGSAVATPGDDAALRVGHMVLALGYGPRASWGVISALGPRWRSWRGGDIDRLVRLDLVLYPGFSGGPLVDAAGRVVGLNTSASRGRPGWRCRRRWSTRVADELLRKGHVSRGYLGLGMQPVRLPGAAPRPARSGRRGPDRRDGGARRDPRRSGGVLLGDVLVALDGEAVGDLDDVQARLGSDRVGTEIGAVVLRGGVRAELRITVGEQPRRRG